METAQLLALGLYGFFMGLERSGIRTINMPVIPFVISAFGPMAAMGYMLPIVLIADIFSITYYKRNADFRLLARTFPGAVLGIVTGTLIGKELSVPVFKGLVGAIIIISLCFIIFNDIRKKKEISGKAAVAAGLIFAFFTGLASMLGASGGPVILTYLLMLNLSKEKLIGTSAYFFFFVNITKLPMYLLVWHNISVSSLMTNLSLIPVMALGIIAGLQIVKRFSNRFYRYFIIGISFISAVRLFF